MTTVIKELTREELEAWMRETSVVGQLPSQLIDYLKREGWTIDEFAIELLYKDYPLVIEFCIGDYCTYPCSKKGHWLLEKKYPAPTFVEAYLYIQELKARIDRGEHWVGEDN